MSKTENILIVAKSGRMLAQMASRLGYGVVVIDCFSDLDTQQVALECVQVDGLGLDSIKTTFYDLNKRYDLSFAILGSGFECHIASLDYLHQQIKVLGNTVDVFSAIQNKENFFATLSQLDIPYPETSFQPPKAGGAWLTKPLQGEGGLDIRQYNQALEKSPSYYWQHFIDGEAMSVLFAANNSGFKICGFHKQQVVDIDHHNFLFSGIISQPNICDSIKKTVGNWVAKLVDKYSLQGINTLDFMMKEGRCYVLEINARPSASMQLYNDELITSHINSCLSRFFDVPADLQDYRAYQIFYAEMDTIIAEGIEYPDWVVDIPLAKSFIFTEMPICSIIARCKSEQQVVDKLLLRRQYVQKLLK